MALVQSWGTAVRGAGGAQVAGERRDGARRVGRGGGCTAGECRAGAWGVGRARLGSCGPCVVRGGDLLSATGLAKGRSWGIAESCGLVTWRLSRGPQRGDVGPVGVHNAVARHGKAGAVPRSGAGVICVQKSC